MHWFVKGHIIEEIGEKMNWAKVATIKLREKTQKEEIKMMKSGSLKFFGKGVGDTSSRFECEFCSYIIIETTNQFDNEPTIVCP